MSHSIKHRAGRILNISTLAFCQDLVTASAASLLDHANSEELTVLACCVPLSVTPNQADSNAPAQIYTCTHYN